MKGITSNPALDAYQRMAVSPVGAPRPAEKVAQQGEAGAARAAPKEAATVSISAEARVLAANASGATSDPEKVARLKGELEAGQLKFDSKQIAEKLIASIG